VESQDPDDFEEKVLQVIRDNPEVLMDSVRNFQQQQQQEQEQQRQQAISKVTSELMSDPDQFIGDSPQMGADDQRLILVEFSDFQCPFCARAHSTINEFMDAYGQEVTLVYKHLPLSEIHPEAVPAAKASWAAHQQEKFWEFHSAIFTNQQRLGNELYIEIAKDLELDIDQFNRDRNSQEAEKAIEADLKLAEELGLSGTPFFLLNDIPLSGARPFQDFETALEEAKQKLK
jgi:protein-disulfide isomerase